jgi:2-oxoglutarate ferredoxin oxidoreductase subunit gamma
MHTEIIVAGSGGQGVLFAGTLIAQACIEEDKFTTWFPSYGAEMRGGTANSTVIISDSEIGSPIAANPDVFLILNEQSYKKFLPKVKSGATLVINSSLIKNVSKQEGVKIVCIPATDIADKEIGDIRTANVVLIGAWLRVSGVLSLKSAQAACKKLFASKPKLAPINQKALDAGYEYTK